MNILLLAYKYPPYHLVGGLRWTNLTRQMVLKGHDVHVLTVKWPKSEEGDPILESLPKKNLFIHRLPPRYPVKLFFGKGKDKFIVKVFRKLWKIFSLEKVFYWDDLAQRWDGTVIPYALKVIKKEKIDCVIATGHPFRVNYFASKIKKKAPEVKLVQDFRDPWAQDILRELSTKKKAKQLKLQRETIVAADLCVGVTKGLIALMSENGKYGKWMTVPNGYNEKLFCSTEKPKGDRLCFIYIGNLGCGRMELFEQFVQSCSKFEKKIKIIYIGTHDGKISNRFKNEVRNGFIEVHGFLPQDEVFKFVVQSDWAIQLNSKAYSYLVSTKIYEYGMLKVPTLSINFGGEIDTLIREHDLGVSVNLDIQKSDSIIEDIVLSKEKREFRFDITRFSYDKLADEYLNLLGNL